MSDSEYGPDPDHSGEVPDWLTAVAIAVSIVILIFVFAWIVIRLEPVLSDFVATGQPPPTATPVQ